MEVLVTVKEVATVTDEVVVDDDGLADHCLEYDLNEWDEYALEAAVQLSETFDDVDVTAATVGPERCEETIRMALAKGADRAIRVWDDALDAEELLLDTRVRAALLAAVVERESPDLVLSGVQSADLGFAATGVALAEAVDYAWAAVVNSLEVRPEEGVATVHRELEGGIEELSEVQLPAVLTIQTGINTPRYASLRGIRQAQSKPLETLGLADLAVERDTLESALTITDMFEPESTGDAEYWTGGPEEQAAQLADFLRDSGVIEG